MTTIEVTTKHILEGTRGSCSKCPVALAVAPHLKQHYYPDVRSDEVRISDIYGSAVCGIPTSPDVESFIHRFDAHSEVMPFSFLLDIPQRYLREEAR